MADLWLWKSDLPDRGFAHHTDNWSNSIADSWLATATWALGPVDAVRSYRQRSCDKVGSKTVAVKETKCNNSTKPLTWQKRFFTQADCNMWHKAQKKTNPFEGLWFDRRRRQVQESVQSPTAFRCPTCDLARRASGRRPCTDCCTCLSAFKHRIQSLLNLTALKWIKVKC